MPATIARRLSEIATAQPAAPFCTFIAGTETHQISFGELMERSAAYARHYLRIGVKRADVVIIILQHTPHLFYSYLGAILAGAIPSFMPFPTPKQRPELYWADHEALFERIRPRLIVTYEDNLRSAEDTLTQFQIESLIARDEILGEPDRSHERLPGFEASAEDVACLQHSSGTTGLKKGVMLTHRAIFDEVASYAEALAFGPEDSIASWLPLYHDMGFVACFMSSVLLGTCMVALDPFEWVMRPATLLDAIERYRATFCWLPNFAFSHIAGTARAGKSWDLSSIRALINCSEPCKPGTFERFASRFSASGISAQKLQVCYAMAENVFAVTQTSIDGPARVVRAEPEAFSRGSIVAAAENAPAIAVLSCGAPIRGVRIEIRSETGQPLPDGTIGEVHLTSPYLFSGYYRLPEQTAKKLRGKWYASGDLGFMRDGELYVTGRADDMIIVNGQNFYAHEIEDIANGVPGMIPGRSIAIGVEDERMDATVVAVLAECKPQTDLTLMGQDVRKAILEKLGLAVHAFVPLQPGQLVKTTSGKISRSKNKELYLDGGFR